MKVRARGLPAASSEFVRVGSSRRIGGTTPEDPRRCASDVRRLSSMRDDGRLELMLGPAAVILVRRFPARLPCLESTGKFADTALPRRTLDALLSAAMNPAFERNCRKSSASSHKSISCPDVLDSV